MLVQPSINNHVNFDSEECIGQDNHVSIELEINSNYKKTSLDNPREGEKGQ
jgi:hypothetical protein